MIRKRHEIGEVRYDCYTVSCYHSKFSGGLYTNERRMIPCSVHCKRQTPMHRQPSSDGQLSQEYNSETALRIRRGAMHNCDMRGVVVFFGHDLTQPIM